MTKFTLTYVITMLTFLNWTNVICNAQNEPINFAPLFDYPSTGDLLLDLATNPSIISHYSAPDNIRNTNFQAFGDVLLQLKKMSGPQANIPSLDELSDRKLPYSLAGVIPLVFIDYSYNYFHDDIWNSAILDPDTALNKLSFSSDPLPFLTKDTISLLHVPFVIEKKHVRFILPSNLYFTNNPMMQNFQVDFGDGKGYVDIQIDKFIDVEYPDFDGDYKENSISIKLTQRPKETDTDPIISPVVQIYVPKPDVTLMLKDLDFQDCFPNDLKGDARINIRYGKDNAAEKVMRNPLIFVEGLDFDINPKDNQFGDITWATIMTGMTFTEFGMVKKSENLEDIRVLSKRLYEENYDLIFVDFRDGAGDMFANGNALIKVIQYIDQTMESANGISVLGASMGGLLARYAIRRMEMEGCNVCVKLYGTFDSPHQGANAPIGLQHAVSFIKDESVEAYYGYQVLKRPASQQMLIDCIIKDSEKERARWQGWLDLNGQPQNCRKIAITNGSNSGKSIGFNPEDQIYYFDHIAYGTILMKIAINAVPDCLNENICERKVFEGVLPVGSKNTTKYINMIFGAKYKSLTAYAKNTPPLDNCSGGSSNWLSLLNDALNNYLRTNEPKGQIYFSSNNKKLSTFVPSYSALDLKNKTYFPDLLDLFPNSEKHDLHPFDYIFYNSDEKGENQLHVKFDDAPRQNIDWIMWQLDHVLMDHPVLVPESEIEFNYNLQGTTYDVLMRSMVIGADGIFQLNKRRGPGYMNNPNAIDKHLNIDAHFSTNYCGGEIVVEKGGKLELGDNEKIYPACFRATLHVLGDGLLELKEGSSLYINDGSTISIEDESQLIIHPGANIYLVGAHASIRIEGELVLKNGAIFEPKTISGNELGQIHFYCSKNKSNVILEGNAGLKLIGSSPFNDTLIQVFNSPLYLPLFSEECILEKGKIHCNESTGIHFNSDASLSYLSVSSSNKSDGLDFSGNHSVEIKNSQFSDLKDALTFNKTVGSPALSHITFTNCTNGLIHQSDEFNASNLTFIANDHGADILYTNPSSLSNFIFKENEVGLIITCDKYENESFKVEESLFENNATGIQINNEALTVFQCNHFLENDLAVLANENSTLNLSTSISTQNYFGGYNTFEQNITGIELFGANLFLKDGHNNWISDPSAQSYDFLQGELNAKCECLDLNMELEARSNHWEPIPLNGNLKLAQGYYSLNVPTRPNRTIVKLNGTVATSPFETCFSNEDNGNDNDRGKNSDLSNLKTIDVYPNPTSNHVMIDCKDHVELNFDLMILDLKGAVLQSFKGKTSPTGKIRLEFKSEMNAGVYFMQGWIGDIELNQKIILK
jgi:hypothetical protein